MKTMKTINQPHEPSVNSDVPVTPVTHDAPLTHVVHHAHEVPITHEAAARRRMRNNAAAPKREARRSDSDPAFHFEVGNCVISLHACELLAKHDLSARTMLALHQRFQEERANVIGVRRAYSRTDGKPIASNFPLPFDGMATKQSVGVQVVTNAARTLTVIRTVADTFSIGA